MSTMSDVCETIVGDDVCPRLIELGFTPHRQLGGLARWSGDRHEYLWFHSLYDKDYAVIESGVFVGFKSLAKFFRKCAAVHDFASITDTAHPNCVRAYVHKLKDPRGSNGWSITPETDSVALGNQIFDECINYGLPFIERFSTIPLLIAHWKSERRQNNLSDPDEFRLAAALWLQGERQEAIEKLNFLVEWRTHRLQQDSPSPSDIRDQRIATEVLEWFKGLV